MRPRVATETVFDSWENGNGPKPSAGNTRPGLTLNRTLLDRRAAMQSTQSINRHRLARSSEAVRFAASTVEGPVPDWRPDLGPCLLWVGSIKPNGYGQMRWHGKNGYVHRYAWTVANGPIPEGMTVDHLCRVRNCARVDHMGLCTAVENYRRSLPARTKCRAGHEKVGDNLYIDSRGTRRCVKCLRVNQHQGWLNKVSRRGCVSPRDKLTESDVRDLREAHGIGVPIRELMSVFGLSETQVRRIVNFESWKSVQ